MIMDPKNSPTNDLLNIISKAMDAKVYGSVEVYLEDGQITQISQRIIKKIRRNESQQPQIKKSSSLKNPESEITLKFQN